MNSYNLDRFIEAQKYSYENALREIREGHKRTHWIWFIFPQLKGLGFSSTASYYGIEDIGEARAYMKEPMLREHLLEITAALLELPDSDPAHVMGCPDDMKLRSCMTLFREAAPQCLVFRQVLDKFYGGIPDSRTLALLGK